MKVYILGAGASLASQGDLERIARGNWAPLVNDLFDERYTDHAVAVGLGRQDLASYRESFQAQGGSLEKWLTDRWDAIRQMQTTQAQRAERMVFGRLTFYIWWLMQRVSETYHVQDHFLLFLRNLTNADQDFALINFNYDTLLDRALVELGFPLNNLHDYLEAKYVKPHGSVNWLLNRRSDEDVFIDPEDTRDQMVRLTYAASTMYEEPIPVERVLMLSPLHQDLRHLNLVSSARFNRQFFYPLILLPLTTKLYQHFGGFDERLIAAGKSLLATANEVFLVGYRAQDKVIREMFEGVRPDTSLHVIGRNDAGQIMTSVLEWKPELRKGTVFTKGFARFIDSMN
jgi:hypothetical protein